MDTVVNGVRTIVASKKFEVPELLGQFLNESHYDVLIEEDTDCYVPLKCSVEEMSGCERDCGTCPKNGRDENRVAFIFRKNFFSKEQQDAAYKGLRDAAAPSQNRGIAAGPKGEKCANREWVTNEQLDILDDLMIETPSVDGTKDNVDAIRAHYGGVPSVSNRGTVWLNAKTTKDEFIFDQWVDRVRLLPIQERSKEAKRVAEEYISLTTYANTVNSGVAGAYDRYPRIPHLRQTAYTENNYEKFSLSFPFLQTLNEGFKNELPKRWANQKAAADKIDHRYLVPDTVFTTITVNKNFRTAAHFDAGDLVDGMSNLLVLSNDGDFTGGYLVAPEYRIAVNVRPGDLLLVANHDVMHGNTPIVLGNEKSERISVVCYFREGMLEGGVKEYEDLRAKFVDSRRLNKDHPLWRPLWNGISPSMFSSGEWYDYVRQNGDVNWLKMYHPEALAEKVEIDL